MDKLLDQIMEIEFTTGSNFSYDLDQEFNIISYYLNSKEQNLLRQDFERFFEKGQFMVLNTFGGGILFLKVSELIEKIKIEYSSESDQMDAMVEFKSETRRSENIKYKPNAGKIESVSWNVVGIFPNLSIYHKLIQAALILVIGKIVKRICEYGRTNFAYMKIENEFEIELVIDGQMESTLNVEIN